MSITIIHRPTGRDFKSDEYVLKCPFGKNRRVRDTVEDRGTDVCSGCQDVGSAWMNSYDRQYSCYYEKQSKK